MINAKNVFTGTNSVVRAHIQAFSAFLAEGINETYLNSFGYTFGISAPLAG
jgi:hypothetical protein